MCSMSRVLPAFMFFLGKRRYDRKQSGYGGQTKPIFRKKVCWVLQMGVRSMDAGVAMFNIRPAVFKVFSFNIAPKRYCCILN